MKDALIITIVVIVLLSGLAAPFMYPTPLGQYWPWITFSGSGIFILGWIWAAIDDLLAEGRHAKKKAMEAALRREIEKEVKDRLLTPPDLHRI